MKQFFTLILFLCFCTNVMHAQLVNCRPRISMINYNYHDDSQPNTDMTTIKNIKPDILIDNTPHGFWGEANNFVGCNPAAYTPLGIEVYSYIAGGWEGTHHLGGADTSDLATNLIRIQGIKTDGATGVFLDEVSGFPNTNAKQYITAIYQKCQQLNLKLILNPGVQSFDPWLMEHCNYILTDEHYSGTRLPTSSELPYLNRVLVVAQNVTNVTDAAGITIGARNNGFGFSYACTEYINIPSWIVQYEAQITQSPITPVITNNGGILSSSANYGNQWYEVTSGIIAGANGKNFTPNATGTYYAIVTLDGCHSDTSNKIYFTSTSVYKPDASTELKVFPNPSGNIIYIISPSAVNIQLTGIDGKVILYKEKATQLSIRELADGVYFLSILDQENRLLKVEQIVKQ